LLKITDCEFVTDNSGRDCWAESWSISSWSTTSIYRPAVEHGFSSLGMSYVPVQMLLCLTVWWNFRIFYS